MLNTIAVAMNVAMTAAGSPPDQRQRGRSATTITTTLPTFHPEAASASLHRAGRRCLPRPDPSRSASQTLQRFTLSPRSTDAAPASSTAPAVAAATTVTISSTSERCGWAGFPARKARGARERFEVCAAQALRAKAEDAGVSSFAALFRNEDVALQPRWKARDFSRITALSAGQRPTSVTPDPARRCRSRACTPSTKILMCGRMRPCSSMMRKRKPGEALARAGEASASAAHPRAGSCRDVDRDASAPP